MNVHNNKHPASEKADIKTVRAVSGPFGQYVPSTTQTPPSDEKIPSRSPVDRDWETDLRQDVEKAQDKRKGIIICATSEISLLFERLNQAEALLSEARNALNFVAGQRDGALALVDESRPHVQLVEAIAEWTEFDAQIADTDQIRDICRKIVAGGGPYDYARQYSEEDRERARRAISLVRPQKSPWDAQGDIVDAVAQALGMRRAGA